MGRLTKRELQALLEFIKDSSSICDRQTFARRVVSRLSQIVPQKSSLVKKPAITSSQPVMPCRLSPREAQVLLWVAEGKTNKEVSVILELSPRTVQKHLEHIYEKMCVETRTAAAAKLYETAAGRTRSSKIPHH